MLRRMKISEHVERIDPNEDLANEDSKELGNSCFKTGI